MPILPNSPQTRIEVCSHSQTRPTAQDPTAQNPTTPIHDKFYRILLRFKKEGKISSETMTNMRQLHPQLYAQPKIHKLGAPIRPVVSFYNTPLSALHKVIAHFLKPLALANSSIRLKDTNDFKQHLNTTGHPNFSYHTSLDIKSLYTSCDIKKSLSTTILHFQEKPHLLSPNISASTIHSLYISVSTTPTLNSTANSTHNWRNNGIPTCVELAEIRVADVENTALTTYTDPPNIYDTLLTTALETFVINHTRMDSSTS